MIIEYEAQSGRIYHVIDDPVSPGVVEALTTNGNTFASFPPVPWPHEQVRDRETGDLLFDENGDPVTASQGMDFCRCDLLTDYFHEGQIKRRPDCGCAVSTDGLSVSIADLPDGSAVTVFLDPIDPQDLGIDVPVVAGNAAITLDEAGPLRLLIVPPWPNLEETHVLDVQPG